ncbi:MAG: FHA domain-containing protein [Deltaproteobacteria bacterium]|nr:FHA domain-containing protein [Deltaproteobacteria bacterium]
MSESRGYARGTSAGGPRQQPTPASNLAVEFEHKLVPVELAPVFFGRDPANTVQLQSAKDSRFHAIIYRVGDRHLVRDLHSKNGTLLNGRPIRLATIQPGDQIGFGAEQATVRLSSTAVAGYGAEAVAVQILVADADRLAERHGSRFSDALAKAFELLEDQTLLQQGCPGHHSSDGLSALFGIWDIPDRRYSAPDKALELAAHAAEFLSQRIYQELDQEESCDVRIGLAAGGWHQTLDGELDLHGDAMTAATGLARANPVYGTRVLLEEAVHQQLRKKEHLRELDLVRIKGVPRTICIFAYDERAKFREVANTAVTSWDAVEAPLEYLGIYRRGLESYRAGNFVEAYQEFSRAESLYRDLPARAMRDRVLKILDLKESPEYRRWSGVWDLATDQLVAREI